MAEFFRIGLVARLCEVSPVVSWADRIVEAEPSPHIAFIELCVAGSQSVSAVLTLLAEVPGTITQDLPTQMLLGYGHRLVETGMFSPQEVLLRLYKSALTGDFPECFYYELSGFDDAIILAADGVYGSVVEVEKEFTEFLAPYGPYSPDLPDQSA